MSRDMSRRRRLSSSNASTAWLAILLACDAADEARSTESSTAFSRALAMVTWSWYRRSLDADKLCAELFSSLN